MPSRTSSKRVSAGEALGRKLLQSVREMKAGVAARVTQVELNDVAQALIQIAKHHPEVVREVLA